MHGTECPSRRELMVAVLGSITNMGQRTYPSVSWCNAGLPLGFAPPLFLAQFSNRFLASFAYCPEMCFL